MYAIRSYYASRLRTIVGDGGVQAYGATEYAAQEIAAIHDHFPMPGGDLLGAFQVHEIAQEGRKA